MSGDAGPAALDGGESLELGLQAERTLLAWTRTAFSFVVTGVLLARAVVVAGPGARLAGLVLAGLGAAAAAAAVAGWRRRPGTVGSTGPVRALAVGTACLAAVAALAAAAG